MKHLTLKGEASRARAIRLDERFFASFDRRGLPRTTADLAEARIFSNDDRALDAVLLRLARRGLKPHYYAVRVDARNEVLEQLVDLSPAFRDYLGRRLCGETGAVLPAFQHRK